jgi:hypothetical protein
MSVRRALVVAAILGMPAVAAVAQPAPEPPQLTLPMGAHVRVQTTAAPGSWVKGILVSADSATIALVPQNAPPLGANQLRLPRASVGRFELQTGSKRHWLVGLAVGVALGVAWGATTDVNPDNCGYASDAFCSRGEAIAGLGLTLGGIGAGIGALVKTDRWTPVALDALAPPPPPRVSGIVPRLRALPGGGVGLGVAVGF